MPTNLTETDIRRLCDDSAYRRGLEYFKRGLVKEFTVVDQGPLFVQIHSAVKGNALIPYKQNIRVIWKTNQTVLDLIGDCSCPVGYNCKHVAAVCLKFALDKSNPANLKQDGVCFAWLDGLSTQKNIPQPDQDFLAYFLLPGKNAYEFLVELAITKLGKRGRLNKGRKTNLSNLRFSHSYFGYLRPEDKAITRLLETLETQAGLPLVKGDVGHLALTKMLKSQRLFWLDGDRGCLREGDRLSLAFSWRHLDGHYLLNPDLPGHCQLIPTDPPHSVDTEAGLLGSIALGRVDSEQLEKILTIPLIPENLADQFGLRLVIEHPSLPLPPPKPIHLVELEGLAPTPVLHLFGQRQGGHYLHFLGLSFQYGLFRVNGGQTEHHTIIDDQHLLTRIHRDPLAETHALAHLHACGVTPSSLFNPEPYLLLQLAHDSAIESATSWHHFLQPTAPTASARTSQCLSTN